MFFVTTPHVIHSLTVQTSKSSRSAEQNTNDERQRDKSMKKNHHNTFHLLQRRKHQHTPQNTKKIPKHTLVPNNIVATNKSIDAHTDRTHSVANNPPPHIVRVPDPKRGLELKFRSESSATFVFFALMGRKYDAEVEFTCCHSQKSAKVGFSKGFLSDLIGPDRVVDTSRGQPARCRWEDETMAISCKTMHLVVV